MKWETGIDNLWKPTTIKSNLNGTAIMDWHEADTPRYRLDDKPKKLEACLNMFVRALIRAAEMMRGQRLQREAQEKIWREEEERRERKRKRQPEHGTDCVT